ncbi:MAG: cobalamin biosynthesis protein [Clostridia bacterium]|nr:cobalamin biosynthesis protein [Clostridia bacterium]
MKRIDIICFSDAGAALAEKLQAYLSRAQVSIHSTPHTARQYAFEAHENMKEAMGEMFAHSDAVIFICAVGIAVRTIAPFIQSKTTDPAVVVMDDQGRFAISLLSGHIGGANTLAKELAAAIGAQAVITTATDGAGKFSCDAWAAEHDCAVSSMALAKKVSAEILKQDIPVATEFPLPETLPGGLSAGDSGTSGIYIGVHTEEPFIETLRLIPRILTLGIGCRRGATKEQIVSAVETVLQANQIDARAIAQICSIDVKKDEVGLLEAAKHLNVPIHFYSAAELLAVPGNFEESAFVYEQVGVGNVCERAAVISGETPVIPKTAADGVTIAAAIKKWSIVF